MSSARMCDNCDRREEAIFGYQPSEDRWLHIRRAHWFSGEAAEFDVCSWACLEAFAKKALTIIEEFEATRVSPHLRGHKAQA